MSWRATVPCSRVQAETVGEPEQLFTGSRCVPVLVADEPDPAKPDSWLIHAYFAEQPTADELAVLATLGSGQPETEKLPEQDWVRVSQGGLEPIQSGRFYVRTPYHSPRGDRINFEIDAGLAFGTGQHATTAGCLEVLDKLEQSGAVFENIADIGTGTGLLAFAALALWPEARCIASDIDGVAVEVARENAAINRVALGHQPGELLLVEAAGTDSPFLLGRAPFDLVVANILAGPLIELASDFSRMIQKDATIILAGLLDTQAAAVIRAYEEQGIALERQTAGEWPVLVLNAGDQQETSSARGR